MLGIHCWGLPFEQEAEMRLHRGLPGLASPSESVALLHPWCDNVTVIRCDNVPANAGTGSVFAAEHLSWINTTSSLIAIVQSELPWGSIRTSCQWRVTWSTPGCSWNLESAIEVTQQTQARFANNTNIVVEETPWVKLCRRHVGAA